MVPGFIFWLCGNGRCRGHVVVPSSDNLIHSRNLPLKHADFTRRTERRIIGFRQRE
jgi:hypothetical protein